MRSLLISLALLFVAVHSHAEEPLIVAHRGASRDAPENTLPAFKLAWEQGADAIEGDFRLTQDGQIVCIHDEDTQRVAARKLVISESPLKALRELDVGAYRGEIYAGTVIPTIAEVFATIPAQKKIYIEIKSDESIIPYLLEEIRIAGLAQDQVTLISFDKDLIKALKARAPQYKALWLSSFKKDQLGNITPSIETTLNTLDRIKADGFSSSKNLIEEALVNRVLAKGYEYHVWTVDDLELARRFKAWGAKSITTNVPGYLKKNL